jgi:hypothetical protein
MWTLLLSLKVIGENLEKERLKGKDLKKIRLLQLNNLE